MELDGVHSKMISNIKTNRKFFLYYWEFIALRHYVIDLVASYCAKSNSYFAYGHITVECSISHLSLPDSLIQNVRRDMASPEVLILFLAGAMNEPVNEGTAAYWL